MGWTVSASDGWQHWRRGQASIRIEWWSHFSEEGMWKILGRLNKYGGQAGRDVVLEVLAQHQFRRPDGSVVDVLRMLPPAPATPRRQYVMP